MAAGAFIDRLEWLKRAAGTPDTFGARVDVYTSQGTLWCAVEDVAGTRATEQERERQLTTASIRVRNLVGIAAGDRLRDAALAETWTVRTVVGRGNETVCEVDR